MYFVNNKRSKALELIDMEKEKLKKIKEWHNLVVNGLVKGLSNTSRDERLDDIEFWRKRSELFNLFNLCVSSLINGSDYKYSEKELKEISNKGYKLK